MSNKKWLEPDLRDPLGEPTLNRRLWAAYLARGYQRRQFAEAMGVRYAIVSDWDHGRHVISLAHLVKAAELVGFGLDQLVHGKRPVAAAPRGPETSLKDGELRDLLDELRVSDDQSQALGEWESSPRGKRQRFTRTYVSTFAAAYAAARKQGSKREDAIERAHTEASNARATVDAVDAGRSPLNGGGGNEPTTGTVQIPKRKRAARKQPLRMPTSKPTAR